MQLIAVVVCLSLSPALGIPAASQLASVLEEAHAIWRPLGVTLRLIGSSDDGCDRLIVVRSSSEARPEDASSSKALGWVPFVEGRARRVIFLRVDRARTLIASLSPGAMVEGLRERLLAKLLGRIVAHELGHVLLNTRDHVSTGLMRERYSARDVLRDPPSAYSLSVELQHQLETRLFNGSAQGAR